MSIILNIDTSVESGSVSLSQNGKLIMINSNENIKDHAAWLHNSIKDLFDQSSIKLTDLGAIAVSNGPGSYTGLRISLSAAKGICYSLKIPLITISTLQIMASAAMQQGNSNIIKKDEWLCPMIDARRMESYFAVFDTNLSIITSPQSAILNETTFSQLLKEKRIIFFGNGSSKLQLLIKNNNALFEKFDLKNLAQYMCPISHHLFLKEEFADTALCEPLYIKDFFTTGRKES